jgi:iron complex outermembrane receptor protein
MLMTLDVQVSYFVNESFTLSAGANNLLDQEAQKLQRGADGAYSIVGGEFYESGPFDYNGGYYYVKAQYNF